MFRVAVVVADIRSHSVIKVMVYRHSLDSLRSDTRSYLIYGLDPIKSHCRFTIISDDWSLTLRNVFDWLHPRISVRILQDLAENGPLCEFLAHSRPAPWIRCAYPAYFAFSRDSSCSPQKPIRFCGIGPSFLVPAPSHRIGGGPIPTSGIP